MNFYEAVMFTNFDILAPPAATVPHGWRISSAGVPVAPLLVLGGVAMQSKMVVRRRQMPAWKRALPRYAAASPYWPALFKKERKDKIGNRIVYGRVVHRDLRNREGRERFWSVPGWTKYTVIAAARREEVLRLANNAEIVEVPFDNDEEAGGSEDCGSESEIVDLWLN